MAEHRFQPTRFHNTLGPHEPTLSIAPGDTHSYSSGAVIETPVGTMEGRYGMLSSAGVHFSAHIPVFRLAVPGVLN